MKVLKDSFCPCLTASRLPTLLLCLELEMNWVRNMSVMWSYDRIDADGKTLHQSTATP